MIYQIAVTEQVSSERTFSNATAWGGVYEQITLDVLLLTYALDFDHK